MKPVLKHFQSFQISNQFNGSASNIVLKISPELHWFPGFVVLAKWGLAGVFCSSARWQEMLHYTVMSLQLGFHVNQHENRILA